MPIPHDCVDGFFHAYWRRPEAYLDPEVRAGISAFALMDRRCVAEGLARLERDLGSGEWARRNADLLELDELDGGYRLVVHEAEKTTVRLGPIGCLEQDGRRRPPLHRCRKRPSPGRRRAATHSPQTRSTFATLPRLQSRLTRWTM